MLTPIMWPFVYSSLWLSLSFPQTRPCSMTECWVCHDKRRNAAECVRNSSHHDCSLTFSFCPSVPLSRPVTASTMSSLINYSCGPISPPKDAFMVTSTYPSSSKWGPVSVAAHLHLLGEALCLIGLHLKSTNVSTFVFLT